MIIVILFDIHTISQHVIHLVYCPGEVIHRFCFSLSFFNTLGRIIDYWPIHLIFHALD